VNGQTYGSSRTRLSTSCCETLADVDAPEILCNSIQPSNRSLPHVELPQLVLPTLENVSSFPNCSRVLGPTTQTFTAYGKNVRCIKVFILSLKERQPGL